MWSLLPLSSHPCLMTAPASWTHSKRFAQFGCGFAALRGRPFLGSVLGVALFCFLCGPFRLPGKLLLKIGVVCRQRKGVAGWMCIGIHLLGLIVETPFHDGVLQDRHEEALGFGQGTIGLNPATATPEPIAVLLELAPVLKALEFQGEVPAEELRRSGDLVMKLASILRDVRGCFLSPVSVTVFKEALPVERLHRGQEK